MNHLFFKLPSLLMLLILLLFGSLNQNFASAETDFRLQEQTSSVSSNAFWDDHFAGQGVSGNQVNAIAVQGNHLYIAGEFTNVAGIAANNVAHWDGSKWEAMGNGIRSTAYSIAIVGNEVYVGGDVGPDPNSAASFLVKWDGMTWATVGGGLNGTVRALAVDGNALYAAGSFTTAGGIPANRIAKWDGSQWANLGTGLNNVVYSVIVDGANVYVGGEFVNAGGIQASHIARWDGTNWYALGGGLDSHVYALSANGGKIFAGGIFRKSGNADVFGIAQWDGNSWSQIGAGIACYSCSVNSLATNDGKLYVGGVFAQQEDLYSSDLVVWDGTSWSTLGSGVKGNVKSIAIYEDKVSVVDVYRSGELQTSRVAQWDGSKWQVLGGHAPNGTIGGIGVNNAGRIYAGGDFVQLGNVRANYVAMWDGANWQALGAGVSGRVWNLAVGYDKVFVYHDHPTPNEWHRRLSMWDGQRWTVLVDGISINGMATSGNELYVVGSFQKIKKVSVRNIAKWDGTKWYPVGVGLDVIPVSIAVNGKSIFIGGAFTSVNGITANRVAKWDGTKWGGLGSGISEGSVNTIVAQANNVYVGGVFKRAGGKTANNIAFWNGREWNAMIDGLKHDSEIVAFVSSIALRGKDVFVGGQFKYAGPILANGVARWDGLQWNALGDGIKRESGWIGTAYFGVVNGNDYIVAGDFGLAGEKPSGGFGIWHEPTPIPPKLKSPKNGAVLSTRSPVLGWTASDNATTYRIQILRDSKDGVLIQDRSVESTTFQPSLLKRKKWYFWRVVACNDLYCSVWPGYRSFFIE